MTRSLIKVCNILLTGDIKILLDDAEETKDKVLTDTLKVLNKKSYNYLIIYQEDTVCFHIFEEERTKSNRYEDKSQVWLKI